jgi:hypothetical protein
VAVVFNGEKWALSEVTPPEVPGGETLRLAVTPFGDGIAFAHISDTRHHFERGESRCPINLYVSTHSDAPYPTRHVPFVVPEARRTSAANRRVPGSVRVDNSDYRLVFGNLHRHTDMSVCLRGRNLSPQVDLRAARDLTRESFGALTDHDVDHDSYHWHENLKYTRLYNFQGDFVTIPSFEWTGNVKWEGGPFGHFNVHFFGGEDDARVLSAFDQDIAGTPDRLYKHLNGTTLAIPHHPADKTLRFLWENFDSAHSPVAEIFQDFRGSAEYPGAPGTTSYGHADARHFLQSAWQAGLRFGVIAGGDHFGVALAGLYVSELTRKGILDAFRARRCFATTGCQMLIDVRVNGVFMGGEVALGHPDDIRTIAWHVESHEPARLTVMRNTHPMCEALVTAGSVHGSFVDTANCAEIIDAVVSNGDRVVYYYLRVEREDGEIGWSSPVWVRSTLS